MVCVALSPICPPHSGSCAVLWGFEIPPSLLISQSVRSLPRMWVSFFFCISISGWLVPSFFFFFSSLLSLFFPFVLPNYVEDFLSFFWGLRYFASVQQMFCANCSTCRFFFCGRRWTANLNSSAIFIPSPWLTLLTLMCSKIKCTWRNINKMKRRLHIGRK